MNLLTYKEAAKVLRLNPGTLRRLVCQGKISSHRVGGKVLFTQEDIENAIKENSTGTK